MSSYFDEASLVFIPSGYKTSKAYSVKPTDGTGDLTFTRSNDTATRVGADGLIEKVRTNLAQYSEQFDNAWWGKSNITITANNTTDPFGGSAADKALCAAGTVSPNIFSAGVACTSGVEYTASYYAKQGTSKYAKIRFSSTAFATASNTPIFDLNAGTIVSGTGVITSVGNGWYRISATQTAEATTTGIFTVDIPDSTGVWPNGTFAGTEFIFIFGYQFEISVGVSPYIPTTTAAVSVGMLANVPRLDYLNSSCPRLLLEPQRTNLALFSEQINNTAVYAIQQSAVTANAITSPDGTTNADLWYPTSNSNTGSCRLLQTITGPSSGVSYTASIFVKRNNKRWLYFSAPDASSANHNAFFDIENGVVGNVGSSVTGATIENYGNGWYRCSVTSTATSTTQYIFVSAANGNGDQSVTANGTDGFYFYGSQLEASASYPSSYISTLGAAVTRSADICVKSGISSLLPTQTATLYIEFDFSKTAVNSQVMSIHNNSTGLAWILKNSSTGINATYFNSGFIGSISTSVSASAQVIKVAYAYTNGSQALYINGVQQGVASDAITDSNDFDTLELNGFWNITKDGTSVASAIVFPTRLSNAQLAELTA